MNPYGVIYGPNHCVRPCFPPYQGVIPGPKWQDLGQYATNPAAYQGAMQQYQQAGGFGGKGDGGPGGPGGPGFGGFTRHLWARSPRDFFMYDTDPAASPYNYGYAGSTAPYNTAPYNGRPEGRDD
jgi:hypothetical protein